MKSYPALHQREWLRKTGLRETLWFLDAIWIIKYANMTFKNWINN